MNSPVQNLHFKKYLLIILTLAILFIAIVFSLYFYRFHGELLSDQDKWGVFGDFIGGVINPVLSFFSLMALLLTLNLQNKQTEISRQELTLSRNELIESRKELSRAAEAQEEAPSVRLVVASKNVENRGQKDMKWHGTQKS